jgi:hypothetical protein
MKMVVIFISLRKMHLQPMNPAPQIYQALQMYLAAEWAQRNLETLQTRVEANPKPPHPLMMAAEAN